MHTELAVLSDVCRRLEEGGIHYMLTGSMALNYYAQPRMTRDLDLVVELEDCEQALWDEMFPSAQYYVPDEAFTRARATQGMFNIIHTASVVKVDFIVRKSDPYRRIEFGRRRRVHLDGFDCWIVSREDLILSKLVWAFDSRSDFQLRDVRSLLDADLDQVYLLDWAGRLGVQELLEEVSDGRHQP